MNKRRKFCAGILWLSLAIALSPLGTSSAQSGELAQIRPTFSVSSSQSTASDSDLPPRHVLDSNADKYKLVFAREHEGKASYRLDKPADSAALIQATSSEFDNFVKQLNQEGAQGYKLISAVYGGFAVGMVEFDGVQHEYEWVMTDSLFSALSGKDDKYGRSAKRGFRLVDYFEINTFCPDYGADTSPGGDYCQTRSLFLLEREKAAEKPTPYALVYPTKDRQGSLTSWLTAQVKQKVAGGFFPTKLVSEYGILVEQEKKDQSSPDRQDLRVVSGINAGHPKSSVNELAKHGYRLALLNSRLALMNKDVRTTTPVTYVWLHTTTKKNWRVEPRKRKDFEESLAHLQASGAVYRMVYENNQGYSKLIFEQKAIDDGQRREYKVLLFEFQVDVDRAAQRVSIDMTPESKETMRRINNLAKDGFVVRDLFLSDGYNAVIERTL
jgi:hypothetical protein